MALNKSITQTNGITTEYHKITSVNLVDRNGRFPVSDEQELPLQIDVALTSFLNKEYRETGHSINTSVYNFHITQEEEESMGIRKLAYAKIKTLEIFADAEDC